MLPWAFPAQFLGSSFAGCRIREMVRFGVVLAAHVGDGKNQRASQLPADPMQGIQSRAATAILARHLPHHDLRVGIHVNCLSFESYRALESFEEGEIFGDVVVLATDPLGDPDLSALRIINYYANTGRSGIPQRPAIDVSHQIRHLYATNMLKKAYVVKHLRWFHRKNCCEESFRDCESNVENTGENVFWYA